MLDNLRESSRPEQQICCCVSEYQPDESEQDGSGKSGDDVCCEDADYRHDREDDSVRIFLEDDNPIVGEPILGVKRIVRDDSIQRVLIGCHSFD